MQSKGRIHFHEEGGSSSSHSGYSTLGDDNNFANVFAIDASGKIHVSNHVSLGDENDVFVNGLSHSDVPPVRAAPTFEAIAEWFAEDEESDVLVVVEPLRFLLSVRREV
ncbi:hypothetical protein V6N13_072379 [Hibiscus sabdariffa]